MISVKVISRGAVRRLERAAKIARGEIMTALKRAASRVQRQAKINVRQKLNTTGKSTGALSRSIITKPNNSRLEVAVGPTAIYGRIHELGGVIRPKRAKALAIPIGETKGSPKDYGDMSVVTMGNRAYLAETGNGFIVRRFILKKSVRMPKRPYMRPAYLASKPWIENDMREVVDYIMGERE